MDSYRRRSRSRSPYRERRRSRSSEPRERRRRREKRRSSSPRRRRRRSPSPRKRRYEEYEPVMPKSPSPEPIVIVKEPENLTPVQKAYRRCKEFILRTQMDDKRGIPMSQLGFQHFLKPRPFTGKFSDFLAFDQDFDVYQNRGKPQYVRIRAEKLESVYKEFGINPYAEKRRFAYR